jgi:hypothetical protein
MVVLRLHSSFTRTFLSRSIGGFGLVFHSLVCVILPAIQEWHLCFLRRSRHHRRQTLHHRHHLVTDFLTDRALLAASLPD